MFHFNAGYPAALGKRWHALTLFTRPTQHGPAEIPRQSDWGRYAGTHLVRRLAVASYLCRPLGDVTLIVGNSVEVLAVRHGKIPRTKRFH
jgi:hypothetical protein